MDVLDNPIWNALTTEQVAFAERAGDAARFAPAVTALAGTRTPSVEAFAALATLFRPGETLGLFLDGPPALPPSLAVTDSDRLAQMIHDGPAPEMPGGFTTLGAADIPAMRALADVTRPGPFNARTSELGTFYGLHAGGALVAMAGQRMRLPGLVEISAVCTDPAHLGHGHAARLMTAQLALIRGRGLGAFLHVRASNTRAIALYERLGFRTRRHFLYAVLGVA